MHVMKFTSWAEEAIQNWSGKVGNSIGEFGMCNAWIPIVCEAHSASVACSF